MYPNLYYLFKDIFGVELSFLQIFQSFGAMVAIAFLAAAYFFADDLKRKEKEGLLKINPKKILKGEGPKSADLISSAVLGFVLIYKLSYILLHFSEFTQDTQSFILSTKGNFAAGLAGAVLFAYMNYREKKKQQLPKPELETVITHPYEHVPNMTIIAAISGILGAKIFHNLENWNEFMFDPIGNLLSFSGLTMYGD